MLDELSRPEIGCLQNNQNGYKTTSQAILFPCNHQSLNVADNCKKTVTNHIQQ
jgi:hypothetical protein